MNKFITIEANKEWLEFKKNSFGIEYEIYNRNGIEFIIYTKDIFFKKYLTAAHSPLFGDVSHQEVLKEYSILLQELLQNRDIIGLRHFSLGYEFSDAALINQYFNYQLQEWGSFITQIYDLDELWKSYKSKIRYEVKKSKKILTIRELTLEDFDESLKIKNEAKQRDNLTFISPTRWRNNLLFYIQSQYFFPIGVFKNDIMVATAILSYYGNTMNWGGLAVADYAKKHKINALHYLNWWAIEKSYEIGMKYFDTVGYNPHNRSKREDGIYLFKKRLANLDVRYFNMHHYKHIYKAIHWIKK